eukprot:766816-Hanusia_phi.AAC.1
MQSSSGHTAHGGSDLPKAEPPRLGVTLSPTCQVGISRTAPALRLRRQCPPRLSTKEEPGELHGSAAGRQSGSSRGPPGTWTIRSDREPESAGLQTARPRAAAQRLRAAAVQESRRSFRSSERFRRHRGTGLGSRSRRLRVGLPLRTQWCGRVTPGGY